MICEAIDDDTKLRLVEQEFNTLLLIEHRKGPAVCIADHFPELCRMLADGDVRRHVDIKIPTTLLGLAPLVRLKFTTED